MKESRVTYKTLHPEGKSLPLSLLIILSLIGLFYPFISNDIPILAVDSDGIHAPVLESVFDRSKNLSRESTEYDWSLKPLFKFSPHNQHEQCISLSPFSSCHTTSSTHWLGTDSIGRDSLAGILNGLYIAVKVGFLSSIISLIIGVLFGLVSGYYGDYTLRVSRISLGLWTLFSLVWCYASVYTTFLIFGLSIWFNLITYAIFSFLIFYLFHKYVGGLLGYSVIPIDFIVQRFMEIFKSIPNLVLLLALLATLKKASLWNVIWIIGLIRWPEICRYVRSEMLVARESNYLRSVRALGLEDFRIIIKHALPNVISPVLVSASFGFAIAILMESSLSFLGIGVPLNEITLGSMLNEARTNFQMWWLAVFPGLLIFVLMSAAYFWGQSIERRLDHRLKNQVMG